MLYSTNNNKMGRAQPLSKCQNKFKFLFLFRNNSRSTSATNHSTARDAPSSSQGRDPSRPWTWRMRPTSFLLRKRMTPLCPRKEISWAEMATTIQRKWCVAFMSSTKLARLRPKSTNDNYASTWKRARSTTSTVTRAGSSIITTFGWVPNTWTWSGAYNNGHQRWSRATLLIMGVHRRALPVQSSSYS